MIDIGDGDAAIFKMESHNHPSYIEPYQGAATGVGGILRDVFTMGARPVANLNALRFGRPDHPKTRHLVAGVVAGIGGYGNCVGVPTVGGEVNFDAAYDGNILVNAMTVGVAKTDKIFYSAAAGIGNSVVYVGSKTGRDGIHGATMASADFSEDSEEKRPTVQVGDPFTEKLLIEACLELMASDAIVAIQDMGAAGLTSSSVEMASKGGVGIRLDMNQVPCREERHDALRDDALGKPGADADGAQARPRGRGRGDLPQVGARLRGDRRGDRHRAHGAGVERRDRRRHPARSAGRRGAAVRAALRDPEAARAADRHPREHRHRRGPAEADGLARPRQPRAGCGSNTTSRSAPTPSSARAATPRWCASTDSKKALAITTDCTPRYCYADPVEGGKQAVAEAYRNLCAVGAKPLAITNCLNFGNPQRPEIMGQFVGCVEGMAEACRALDFPVVSGNVSLYNETKGDDGVEPRHPPHPGDRRRGLARRLGEVGDDRVQGRGRAI